MTNNESSDLGPRPDHAFQRPNSQQPASEGTAASVPSSSSHPAEQQPASSQAGQTLPLNNGSIPNPAANHNGYGQPNPQAQYGSRPAEQPTQQFTPSYSAAGSAAPIPGGSYGEYGAFGQPNYASSPYAPSVTSTAPKKQRRRSKAAFSAIALVALGALVGGGVGAGTVAAVNASGGTSSASSSSGTITGATAIDPSTIADVAATASKSVVKVNVSASAGSGTGSGVVVADNGYIVTNNHVVTLDGAANNATITVETSDGQLLDATLVGTDPTVDLAVLKVDASLPVISFADSDKVAVGDTAIAIGSPLGLSNTVTDGIVSAVDRGLQIASSATSEGQDDSSGSQSPFGFWSQNGTQAATESISIPVIQTDASINPGNSGGALLNSAGQLIGVNVAIASMSSSSSDSEAGSIGIGFAIESSLVQRVVEEIIDTGTATHGLLGASVQDVTDTSVGVVGAQIAEVTQGGAAASAGLQAGDVVTEVNGVPVTSATDLTAQVRKYAPDTKVTIGYVRDGSEAQVDVTLGTLQ